MIQFNSEFANGLADRAGIHCTRDSRDVVEDTFIDVTFSATVNAPVAKVDLARFFSSNLEAGQKLGSPKIEGTGELVATVNDRAISLRVEIVEGTVSVRRLAQIISLKDHIKCEFATDIFAPNKRSTYYAIWELSVKESGCDRCELSNRLCSYSTVAEVLRGSRFGAEMIDRIKRETTRIAADIEHIALSN